MEFCWKLSSTSVALGSKFSSIIGDKIGGTGGIDLKGSETTRFGGGGCIELKRERGTPKSSLMD